MAVELPGGNTLSFDNVQTIAGMHPCWVPPASPNSRLALAFGVGAPAEVDSLYEKVTAGRLFRVVETLRCAVGQRYATVADPHANWVDLFAPLAS